MHVALLVLGVSCTVCLWMEAIGNPTRMIRALYYPQHHLGNFQHACQHISYLAGRSVGCAGTAGSARVSWIAISTNSGSANVPQD